MTYTPQGVYFPPDRDIIYMGVRNLESLRELAQQYRDAIRAGQIQGQTPQFDHAVRQVYDLEAAYELQRDRFFGPLT